MPSQGVELYIDTIEIFALVVAHYEKQGVPTKYHVDFEKHM